MKRIFLLTALLLCFPLLGHADPITLATAIATSIGITSSAGITAIAFGLTTGLSLGMSMLGRLLTPQPDRRTSVTAREALSPRQTIYGHIGLCYGTITKIHSDENSKWLEEIHTFAGRGVDYIGNLFLNKSAACAPHVPGVGTNDVIIDKRYYDRLVYDSWRIGQADDDPTAYGLWYFSTGTNWDSTSLQKGCASIFVAFKRSDHYSGVPSVAVDILGTRIYDPRKDTTEGGYGTHRKNDETTWEYSNNAALCYLDYMTTPRTKGGYGVAWANIDVDSFVTAANICDESVSLLDGSTRARYTCDGRFSWDQDPQQIQNDLLSACAGKRTRINGKYGMLAGVWQTPTATLTDSDLRPETLQVQPKISTRELWNGVKVTFLNPDKDWQFDDAPPVVHRIDRTDFAASLDTNDYYLIADDNYRLWGELQLPFTIDVEAAQRIGMIALEEKRRQLTAMWPGRLSCFDCVHGDTIAITRARYSWSAKTFRVEADQPLIYRGENDMPVLGVDLVVREHDADVYDWDPSWAQRPATTTDVGPAWDNPPELAAPTVTLSTYTEP